MGKKLDTYGIFKLINLHRSHAALWDRNSNLYKRKDLKTKAYHEIAHQMNMSVEAVKKKLHSLRTTYTAERWKLFAKKSGSEEDKKYIPTLAWFGEMYFLDEFIITKKTLENLKEKNNAMENILKNDCNEKKHKNNVMEIISQNDCRRDDMKSEENILQNNSDEKKYQSNATEITIQRDCREDESKSDYLMSYDTASGFASTQESYENKCRICLEEKVDLDWNDIIYGHNNMTYKDCYYKYTQLNYFDEDNFPNMLCRNCSNGLEFIDTFITKAIEAHVALQEKFSINMITEVEDDVIMNNENSNLEEIIMEETEIKPELQSLSKNEPSTKEYITITPMVKTYDLHEDCLSPLLQTEEESNQKAENTTKKSGKLKEFIDPLINNKSFVEDKKHSKRIEESICCSICSKVLCSRYKAIKHEKIHENRERKETCVKCGVKFYTRETLNFHMRTHITNREKPYKCEFCDKTFFHRGGLNVHRRIHLGQMIPCTLCTKKYYRQIDLDKHMASHSASRISTDLKTKEKCYIQCKDCGENIRSTSFRSHTAKHMNEPLFKCSICNKEFFFKDSCWKHLKKYHKIAGDKIKNLIISYKKTRFSHLFLQQYASGQVNKVNFHTHQV